MPPDISSSANPAYGTLPGIPGITVSPIGKASGTALANNGANYGPDTTGTTTSGIQEAINAAQATGATLGRVILLAGTFSISTTINITAGVSLVGQGVVTQSSFVGGGSFTVPAGSSLIKMTIAGTTAINVTVAAEPVCFDQFSVEMTGTGAHAIITNGPGTSGMGMLSAHWGSVSVFNTSSTGDPSFYGFNIQSFGYCTFDRLEVFGMLGVSISNNSASGQFGNSRFNFIQAEIFTGDLPLAPTFTVAPNYIQNLLSFGLVMIRANANASGIYPVVVGGENQQITFDVLNIENTAGVSPFNAFSIPNQGNVQVTIGKLGISGGTGQAVISNLSAGSPLGYLLINSMDNFTTMTILVDGTGITRLPNSFGLAKAVTTSGGQVVFRPDPSPTAMANIPAATIPTNPPVSGTVYQNTLAYAIRVYLPVTYSPTGTAAATMAPAVGPTNTPTALPTESEPAGLTAGTIRTYILLVPAGWYFSFTATNATLGTAVAVAEAV